MDCFTDFYGRLEAITTPPVAEPDDEHMYALFEAISEVDGKISQAEREYLHKLYTREMPSSR